MNRGELFSTLQQIKALAERALGISAGHKTRHREVHTEKDANLSPKKTLTTHLIKLRSSGYFKEARTAKEVHLKLKATYPCELNRVAVALFRLHKSKQLRKVSKLFEKKKQVAYVW